MRWARPRWTAPSGARCIRDTGEIYYTLTNNSNRKLEPTASQQALDAANPRSYRDTYGGAAPGSAGNVNGHIIRIAEAGGEPAAPPPSPGTCTCSARSPTPSTTSVNLSALTADQDFSSPDGLWFSRSTRLCWIQTDDGAYTDTTNCMMLAGVPGKVGDGAKTTLNYTKTDGSTVTIDTYVGKTPVADTLRRFLVGPVDCEMTGCAETPDGKTLFVNIQHPGETISAADVANPAAYLSHWPGNAGYGAGGATARPRSATIAITQGRRRPHRQLSAARRNGPWREVALCCAHLSPRPVVHAPADPRRRPPAR